MDISTEYRTLFSRWIRYHFFAHHQLLSCCMHRVSPQTTRNGVHFELCLCEPWKKGGGESHHVCSFTTTNEMVSNSSTTDGRASLIAILLLLQLLYKRNHSSRKSNSPWVRSQIAMSIMMGLSWSFIEVRRANPSSASCPAHQVFSFIYPTIFWSSKWIMNRCSSWVRAFIDRNPRRCFTPDTYSNYSDCIESEFLEWIAHFQPEVQKQLNIFHSTIEWTFVWASKL